MQELMKRLIGREMEFYAVGNVYVIGTVKAVLDDVVILEDARGKETALNLKYVIEITPKNRNKSLL